jgi:hypothetical protein
MRNRPIAELQKDAANMRAAERLQAFAELVWENRWAKGENAAHDSELDRMFAIAAEIRSGNMKGIDAIADAAFDRADIAAQRHYAKIDDMPVERDEESEDEQ